MRLLVLLVAALCAAEAAKNLLVETPFSILKDQNDPKLVVFYHSSDPESNEVLRVANKVARVSFLFLKTSNFLFFAIFKENEA
jgi:hypothetical protein